MVLATLSHADYATLLFARCWALTFAHRARCAAAIFFRAARLIRRAGFNALACFILPCAQRCFSSRDNFLRAAALMRPRRRAFRAVPGGRPLRRPDELTASIAEIACSRRSRSARSSARILLVSIMAPRTGILTAQIGTGKGFIARKIKTFDCLLRNQQVDVFDSFCAHQPRFQPMEVTSGRCARQISLMVRSSKRGWKPIALALLFLGMAARAVADERSASIPHGTVSLVSEQESIQPGHGILLGLHFRLENGWHIYWINPGDSGEPPRLDWHLPAGLRAGAIEWPAPSRLPIPPLMDYGYEGEVLLPVPIESTAGLTAGAEATLAADMKAIICRDVCIPAKAHLSLLLPVRAERPRKSAETAAMFSAARKALPKPAPANWRSSAKDLGDSFELRVNVGHSVSEAWFAPLKPLQIENAAPQKTVSTGAGVRLILKKSDQLLKPVSRLRGVLVLASQGAYLIDAPVAPLSAKKPNQE